MKLREHGIAPELCTIPICNAAEKEVMDESWSRLVGTLMKFMGRDAKTKKDNAASQAQVQPGDDSKCHECKKTSNTLAAALKTCSACAKAWYCSQDCQKKNWKSHKPTCLANRQKSNGSASSSRSPRSTQDPVHYFVSTAHTRPEAAALARSLNLPLPTSIDAFGGTL